MCYHGRLGKERNLRLSKLGVTPQPDRFRCVLGRKHLQPHGNDECSDGLHDTGNGSPAMSGDEECSDGLHDAGNGSPAMSGDEYGDHDNGKPLQSAQAEEPWKSRVRKPCVMNM